MSALENMFLASDRPIREEAELLMRALALEPAREAADPDEVWLRRAAGTIDGYLGVHVYLNTFSVPDPEPDEVQAFDGYPIQIDLWLPGPHDDEQQHEARQIFEQLLDARPEIPALLVHDLQLLKSAYIPGTGRHDFADPTSVDEPDVDVWHPWTAPVQGASPS